MRAGSPMSLSVGVYPTREGVSRKFASFTRISNFSPLKAQSLKVQEPRSRPQMIGVDFIIIELYLNKLNMKIVLILFLLIINIQNKGQSTLSLYTHTWCPPCKKVKSIFTKISANFPEIAFKIH